MDFYDESYNWPSVEAMDAVIQACVKIMEQGEAEYWHDYEPTLEEARADDDLHAFCGVGW